MACIGLLALQGAIEPHREVLRRLGHQTVDVRSADALEAIDGLVLPGGESGVQLRLLERHGLRGPLADFLRSGRPVLATCAGLILLARDVREPSQPGFAALDVAVERNAWGRQIESFEATSDADSALPGLALVFIRAPRIRDVGPCARVLASFNREPVLVQQGSVIGASFHPELSDSAVVHRLAFSG